MDFLASAPQELGTLAMSSSGDDGLDLLFAFALVFLIVASCVVLGIAFGIPAARWLGNRVGQFFTGWSDEKYEIPPPRFAMAAAITAHGDLEDALAFYEDMLLTYPQEEQIYHRMLEIALGPLDRPELAEDILARGLAALASDTQQAALVRQYEELKAGTHRPLARLRKPDDARGGAFPQHEMPAPPPLQVRL